MKTPMISVTERKPSPGTTKLIVFAVSKNEGITKEDTGTSMKNALYILPYAKRLEKTSNNGRIEPVTLAVIELR